MRTKKSQESGSLMVEIMAVIALLGVMGTMMFRQIQRRNEELDNINMASEIRMVKEATAAYIQANKAMLEANNCPAIGEEKVDVDTLPLADIEKFLPDNWISDSGYENGIINEYKIYLSCYRVNSAAADNRLAMYGTVVPNNPEHTPNSPLPKNFTLRRAARVATLIGADGGIFEYSGPDGENSRFIGTMGAWEIECAGDGTCNDWGKDDNFYVATTGMDIYIPEVDKTADNTVAVPRNIAFERLHSTDYFSVGDGSINCISNYNTADNKFAHETLMQTPGGINYAESDAIRNPGDTPCDPLFWVGAGSGAGDGHVFTRQSLYVGRNNSENRQAVAIETGKSDLNNAITVFDIYGNDRLTLNGSGQIIGRVNSGTGHGYKLDAVNGEIILFEEATANIGGNKHTIQMPVLRLTDRRMETNEEAEYYAATGELQTDFYAVDPAGESLMHDIRLTSRGGAKLSEILSDYVLKATQTIRREEAGTTPVAKPSCPRGYAQAISVTPIRYSQYVKGADLNLNLETNEGGTGTHTITGHINTITQNINGNTDGNKLTVSGESGSKVAGSTLTLTQLPPVKIAIDSVGTNWTVNLTYGNQPPTSDDPITALAQTYCVFQDTIRGISHTAESTLVADNDVGLRIEGKGSDQVGVLSPGRSRVSTSCSDTNPCANTETCGVDNYCHPIGSCTDPDNTKLGDNLYCIKSRKVYLECFDGISCGTGKGCVNNRCINIGP